jgi:hypothetical protein
MCKLHKGVDLVAAKRYGLLARSGAPGAGDPGGLATLDDDGKVPADQLPDGAGGGGGGSGVPVALHYRISGQTMTSAPASGGWLPNLAAVNDEPTGTMDQSDWDANWGGWLVDQEIPVSAWVPRGVYEAILTWTSLGGTPPGESTYVSLAALTGDSSQSFTLSGPAARLDATLGDGWARGLLVNTVDGPIGVEIDPTDGANWNPRFEIMLAKIADLPTA